MTKLSPPDLWRRLADVQDDVLNTGENAYVGQRRQMTDQTPSTGPRPGGGRRRLRPGKVSLAVTAAMAVIAAGVMKWFQPAPGHLGNPYAAGRSFVADAGSDLPLHFADGSQVTFRGGSAGRLHHFTGSRAEMTLDRGRLDAHVVHAESTLWLVNAGSFRVRVTGTRFAVEWAPPRLDVVVHEGAVVIEGGALEAGIPLSAGHRLTVDRGMVRTDIVGGAGDSPPKPVWARPTNMGTPSPARDEDWFALAGQGAYRHAHAAARRTGWGELCGRLDARRLLMLGDVARHAGAANDARRAFEALVTRFPTDRLAADAVFSLGRQAVEAQQPRQATRWFSRYLRDWPAGPLAIQANGRLLESAIIQGDPAVTRAAAKGYLARAPDGPHASLASEVLSRPRSGPP